MFLDDVYLKEQLLFEKNSYLIKELGKFRRILMTEEMINLGEQYSCKPIGFTKAVIGEVVSKMTNCAVVKVAQCAMERSRVIRRKSKYGCCKIRNI